MNVLWGAVLALLLSCGSHAAAASANDTAADNVAAASSPAAPPAAAEGSTAAAAAPPPASKAEQQYLKAMEIRDNPSASAKDLRRSVALLYAAAGIEHLSLDKRTGNGSGGGGGSAQQPGRHLTAADVKLVWRNGTMQSQDAVTELMYTFAREGDGAPVNPAIAHRLLEELAAVGHAAAQAEVGLYLSLGLRLLAPAPGGQLFALGPPDLPAALAHYYFAARGGEPLAQMALAYRHLHGHGVPRSCQAAALYYRPVAERVLEMARTPSALPQIRSLRLSHKTAHARPKPTSEQEFLHYQWFADFGNADAARAVAHLLSHGEVRDYGGAVRYLQQAAAAGDPDAMAHLGHMHANGLAVKPDNASAWRWFWRAAEKGHPSGFFGMAYMHFSGQGAEVDLPRALKYFKQAAEGGGSWAGQGDALFYLGIMHLKGWGTPADSTQAAVYLTMASRLGNLLAAYNLAVMHLRELAGERGPAACAAAVAQLKRVAERGWPTLAEANADFAAGEYEWALLRYLKAAELGSELGQSNAAWMLTEGYGYDGPHAGAVAVPLLRRAAEQGSTAALVRIGDSYWYGKGVARDWARAGQVYTQAAGQRVAQALFNLGFMHQFGAGLPKDAHLAKRYYDRAREAAPEAHLATTLALAGLRAQAVWEWAEPALPAAWRGAWARLFGAREQDAQGEAPSARRIHRGPHLSLWWRLRRALSVTALLDAMDVADDTYDMTLVMWLAAILVLVLWRRQMLRQRRAGFFHDGAAPAAQQPWRPQPPQPQPLPQGAAHPAHPPPEQVVQQAGGEQAAPPPVVQRDIDGLDRDAGSAAAPPAEQAAEDAERDS